MKPLTGMDASFLYMETPSQLTHVVGDARPRSRSEGARLLASSGSWTPVQSRMHLLAPFRRRLVSVPVRPRAPRCGSRIPISTSRPHPPRRGASAGHDARAGGIGGRHRRAAARPQPSAVGAAPRSRASRTARSAFVTKMHHSAIDGVTGADLLANLFDLEARRARARTARRSHGSRRRVPTDLELMRARQRRASFAARAPWPRC